MQIKEGWAHQKLHLHHDASTYGSLLSATMRQSLQQIEQAMNVTLPTRYFAAFIEGQNKTCTDFIINIVDDIDRVAGFCNSYYFGGIRNLDNIAVVVTALWNATAKA